MRLESVSGSPDHSGPLWDLLVRSMWSLGVRTGSAAHLPPPCSPCVDATILYCAGSSQKPFCVVKQAQSRSLVHAEQCRVSALVRQLLGEAVPQPHPDCPSLHPAASGAAGERRSAAAAPKPEAGAHGRPGPDSDPHHRAALPAYVQQGGWHWWHMWAWSLGSAVSSFLNFFSHLGPY